MDIDKQIKIGDMAVVIKWPCCGTFTGKISIVRDIWPAPSGRARCSKCNTLHIGEDQIAQLDSITSLISWMKKIPPLSDDDKTEFLEDLKNDIYTPTTV